MSPMSIRNLLSSPKPEKQLILLLAIPFRIDRIKRMEVAKSSPKETHPQNLERVKQNIDDKQQKLGQPLSM